MKRATFLLLVLVAYFSVALTPLELIAFLTMVWALIVIVTYKIWRNTNRINMDEYFASKQPQQNEHRQEDKKIISGMERKKREDNEWIVKLSLVSLSVILMTGVIFGRYVGYFYCQLYHKNNGDALRILHYIGFRNFEKVSLKGENLAVARLHRVNLQEVDLSKAMLQFANLYQANLQEADLTGVNLHRAMLREANLYRARLKGANLQQANLQQACLEQTDLRYTNLLAANLLAANLIGANLMRANLIGANLMRANLMRANLIGANLMRANLIGANLMRANLIGANLLEVILWKANLERANLQGAILWKAELQEAHLKGVNLQFAELQDTNLQFANLQGANLKGANLIKANVTVEQICQCENIEGIRFLSKEFLSKVKKLNPRIMEWWHDDSMVKEIKVGGINELGHCRWPDEEYWTGRWIEPPTSQADKQGEQ